MTNRTHLRFLLDTALEKASYTRERLQCPFCSREELTGIIDEDGPIVLLENKFQMLEDAHQTVLIETDVCTEDISTYSTSYMKMVLTFGLDHWLKMDQCGDFQSAVFFKNHGPLSGGTIAHGHFQIVGLKNIDYRSNITDVIFEGIEIYKEGSNRINISTMPNASATEINIITTPRNDGFMALAIQNIVKYLLKQSSSYNLFFYQWKGSVICKAVPRYVVSPYLMGFSIPHTSNRLESIAKEIRETYYSREKMSPRLHSKNFP